MKDDGDLGFAHRLADLERCFRLTPDALTLARSKRTPPTRLGWAVQWGTVRMLGIFQADHPTRVPERAVAFVADQLDIAPGCLEEYRSRAQAAYEHAWQIRDTFGYREFSVGEEDLRAYLAARVSSPGLVQALDRTSRIAGIGAGKVEVDDVPQVKLDALARYGMGAKAPALADLAADRQGATLLATVRHLETASVDDALDVLEVLITVLVAELMGHADLNTTRRYALPSEADKARALAGLTTDR